MDLGLTLTHHVILSERKNGYHGTNFISLSQSLRERKLNLNYETRLLGLDPHQASKRSRSVVVLCWDAANVSVQIEPTTAWSWIGRDISEGKVFMPSTHPNVYELAPSLPSLLLYYLKDHAHPDPPLFKL